MTCWCVVFVASAQAVTVRWEKSHCHQVRKRSSVMVSVIFIFVNWFFGLLLYHPVYLAVVSVSVSPFSAGIRQGCNIAPDLFLEPMDWVMDRTVHRGFASISIGSQVFTSLQTLTLSPTLQYCRRCWRCSSSRWKYYTMKHFHSALDAKLMHAEEVKRRYSEGLRLLGIAWCP